MKSLKNEFIETNRINLTVNMKCFEIEIEKIGLEVWEHLTVNMKCFEINCNLDYILRKVSLTVNMKCFEILEMKTELT